MAEGFEKCMRIMHVSDDDKWWFEKCIARAFSYTKASIEHMKKGGLCGREMSPLS
jgi:hypothetical protein